MTRAKERVPGSASSKAVTAADSPAVRVLAGQDGIKQWQEEVYRTMHQHPELSNQEHHTAATAADALRKAGYEVTERVGGWGVVGVLRNGPGKTLLIRTDLDALPIKEHRRGSPVCRAPRQT